MAFARQSLRAHGALISSRIPAVVLAFVASPNHGHHVGCNDLVRRRRSPDAIKEALVRGGLISPLRARLTMGA